MANVPQTQMESVRVTLSQLESEFAAALPSQISAKRFIRTAITAVNLQPDLLAADRRSLLAACMRAAQDGLLPDGREAALVVFRSKTGPVVQYLPMVGGILKKLRQSGELASISAHVAYEKDEFDYEFGDNESITHRPYQGDDAGDPTHAYAIVKTKDGAVYREVMTVGEVERVRAASRAAGAGPWSQWWSEMAIKTVIRRLAKRLPSSAEADQIFSHDDEVMGLATLAPPAPAPAGNLRLREALGLPPAPVAIPDMVADEPDADEPGADEPGASNAYD